jgi:hypothetical protein
MYHYFYHDARALILIDVEDYFPHRPGWVQTVEKVLSQVYLLFRYICRNLFSGALILAKKLTSIFTLLKISNNLYLGAFWKRMIK